MNKTWYTKSKSDTNPSWRSLIHFTDADTYTLCGKKITENGRWFIAPLGSKELFSKNQYCPNCRKARMAKGEG